MYNNFIRKIKYHIQNFNFSVSISHKHIYNISYDILYIHNSIHIYIYNIKIYRCNIKIQNFVRHSF